MGRCTEISSRLGPFSKTIVFIGGCEAFANASLARAFLRPTGGASAFLGFDFVVHGDFERTLAHQIFDKMTAAPTALGNAFRTLSTKVDPNSGATLRLKGDKTRFYPCDLPTG
jgi:hypothetical protein